MSCLLASCHRAHSDSEPESDDAHDAELAEIAVVGSHLLGIQRRL